MLTQASSATFATSTHPWVPFTRASRQTVMNHIQPQRARTKIVATVGPACREEDMLGKLVDAGVDVFRLNMAHSDIAGHSEVVARIRRVSEQKGRPIAILADLAGPKIRLGELPDGQITCQSGDFLTFVRGDHPSGPGQLTTNYEKLIDELQVGDRVMLVDGTIRLEVVEKVRDGIRCVVQQAGLIRSRQGVNLPGAKISLPAMSETDCEHAVWAAKNGIDYVSLSFVRTPKEVSELKWLLGYHKSPAHVIAKIEKQEALDQLEAIIQAADGIMVARGDLGVEIDITQIPVVQKRIVAMCNRYDKPVIIATQMLDSMQHSRQPTRAEVTDVANAILDGCDACMLSGETAVGEFPVEAVEVMNRVSLNTERSFVDRPAAPPPVVLSENLKPVTQGVVFGAVHIAQQLKAEMVVVVSTGGATALALSKRRAPIPIVGVSDKRETLNKMCLYWGVIPVTGAPTTDSIELLDHIERWGLAEGCLTQGGYIVLVAGLGLASKGHNMVRVHQVGGG